MKESGELGEGQSISDIINSAEFKEMFNMEYGSSHTLANNINSIVGYVLSEEAPYDFLEMNIKSYVKKASETDLFHFSQNCGDLFLSYYSGFMENQNDPHKLIAPNEYKHLSLDYYNDALTFIERENVRMCLAHENANERITGGTGEVIELGAEDILGSDHIEVEETKNQISHTIKYFEAYGYVLSKLNSQVGSSENIKDVQDIITADISEFAVDDVPIETDYFEKIAGRDGVKEMEKDLKYGYNAFVESMNKGIGGNVTGCILFLNAKRARYHFKRGEKTHMVNTTIQINKGNLRKELTFLVKKHCNNNMELFNECYKNATRLLNSESHEDVLYRMFPNNQSKL